MKPGKLKLSILIGAVITLVGSNFVLASVRPTVAIHDSELTRALEAMAVTNPTTPSGTGTTGFEWWPTNWHYFVMPESLKEALRSDGTAFEVVSDADISAGGLFDASGQPKYPILISLASEAVADAEIAQLTNYVAGGGTILVGSSAFTRRPDGSGRGDFAIADQMGMHMAITNVQNWVANHSFVKTANHALVGHIPNGTNVWRMPSAAEETSWGIVPDHRLTDFNLAWQVQPGDASVLAQGDGRAYLSVKAYGKGSFIYHAGMQPLVGHGGYSPGMYAYGIFRNAIEAAFSAARLPVSRVSPWPFPYDAALSVRHDFEDFQGMINAVESSALFEFNHGVKGDYYFCTGTLREEMTNSPATIASLRRAVTNYGANIGPHNGGLMQPIPPELAKTNYNYWHWGPDEALNSVIPGYADGKSYALTSMSNSFNDVEGWLTGLTNGLRSWVAPYFNATREDSYGIQEQLGIKTAGEQKLGPFPHWTLSTKTPGKRYSFLSVPVSDWFVNGEVAQSMEVSHSSSSVHGLVDFYYGQGALINLYSHSSADGSGQVGGLVQDYITYSLTKPRLWAANAPDLFQWWTSRSTVEMVPSYSTNGNQSIVSLAINGSADPQAAVEIRIPGPSYSGLQVLTNGIAASGAAFRTNGQCVKVLTGTTVTNAEIRYFLNPTGRSDQYAVVAGSLLVVPAPGILGNDSPGMGTNLSAVVVGNPANGVLSLQPDGSFSYQPATNFSGVDGFTYKVNDGFADSDVTAVAIIVTPDSGASFRDNFDRFNDPLPLSPWIVQSGNWDVTEGGLRGGPNDLNSYGFLYVTNNWTNYSVEAHIQFPTGAYGGGIGGYLNPASGAQYAAWIYPEGSPGGSNMLKLIKFRTWTAFGYTNLTSVPMQAVKLQTVGTNWHTLKLGFDGNLITIFYDGNQVLSMSDAETQPYTNGGISLSLWTPGSPYVMTVDEVLVTAPATNQAITFEADARTYGDVPSALTGIASSGLPVSYSVLSGPATVSGNMISVTAAGIVTVRASQSGDGTYKSAPPVDRSFIVHPAVLTVTADPKSKVYGASVPALTASFNGFVIGDTQGVVSGSPALGTTALISSSVGTYPITVGPGSLSASNYIFSLADNSLSVLKAPLAVTGVDTSRFFAEPDPVFTATYSGLVNGDGLSVVSGGPNFTSTAASNSPAGTYPFTLAVGTLNANNYSFNFFDGFLKVLPTRALFYDDFFRRTDPGALAPWIVQSGNWTATDGLFTGGAPTVSTYANAFITNDWTNYSVEAHIQFPEGAYGGGLGGHVNPADGSHYAAWVYPENSAGGSNVLKLIKFNGWHTFGYTNTSGIPMQEVSLPGVGTNWHSLKLIFQVQQISVEYDHVQVISMTDAEAQPYASGGVSLDVWSGTSPFLMAADDVAVIAPMADQSIAFGPPGDRTYGDSPFTLSATASSGLPINFSIAAGPATISNNMVSITGAGTVTVRASQSGNSSFRSATDVYQIFVVSPANLSVTPDNKSRAYGAANPSLTGSINGLRNGDNIGAIYSIAAGSHSPIGSYPILADFTDPNARLGNYVITTNSGVLTIDHAVVTVTADHQSRTYGAPNPVLTVSYSGFANGELPAVVVGGEPQISTTAVSASPVATYPITVTAGTLSASNYSFAFVDGTLTVDPAHLTGTADGKIRLYGETNPVFTVSYNGFVNSENGSLFTGTLVGSTTADTNSPVGNYSITVSGQIAPNYTITYLPGNLSILPAPLGVSAHDASRAYGQANPAFSASFTGFVNGEDTNVLGGTLSLTTVADTSSPVGTYPILASGLTSANYAITYTNGTLTVTTYALGVSANSASRTYGAINPVLTGIVSGLQNGDNVSANYSTTANTNSPVGGYPITVTLVDLDNKLGNYSVTTNTGTLTVDPAALTGTAEGKVRLYGETNPVFTISYSGFVNSENASLVTGTLVGSTTADTNSPVGNYSITVSGQIAPNYTITYLPGNLSILPAPLGVTAHDASRAYGQANPAFSAGFTGFVNGEDTNELGGTLSLTTVADTSSPVGTYPILASGLTSANYAINYTNGTLTVTAHALSVSANSASRTYGAINPVLTGIVSGLQNGDNVSANYSTTANTNSPVGGYPITVTLVDLDNKLGNYSVTTNTGTLTVDPAALTGTAEGKVRLYGETNPVFTISYSGFVNSENASLVTGTLVGSTTADTNSPVGNYPITVSGQIAPNYIITDLPGNLSILPAPLGVTAHDASRAYGQANPAFSAGFTGFVNGEDTNELGGTLSLTTVADTSSPVGTYPILASGLTSANYAINYTNGTLTVTAHALSVSANSASRTYGAINPVLTGIVSGLQNGDNVSANYSTTANTNSPVGGYPITVTLVDPGNKLGNYSVTTNTGTLTVTSALLTVTADSVSRVYTAPDAVFTAQYGGFVNNENAGILGGHPDLTTTATGSSPVGSYAIHASLGTLSATNYGFGFVDGTLTVAVAGSVSGLISSQNPSTEGSAVTFTANLSPVAPATATPTGTVQFLTNGVALGGPVLMAGGIASVSTSVLPAGSNVITVHYGGDGNFTVSTNALTQVVNSSTARPGNLNLTANVDGTMKLTFSGTPGAHYLIQATLNMGANAWTTISTNLAGPGGTVVFTDLDATNSPSRFYRAAIP